MKQYCVDLEIAKELRENGFPQNSYFWWNKNKFGYDLHNQEGYILKKNYSAPISDELLKELPQTIYIEKDDESYYLYIMSKTTVIYKRGTKLHISFKDEKLSNGLAKLWIHLKKEGLLK